MTNDDFQRIVLEELRGLRTDVGGLKEGQNGLDSRMTSLDSRMTSLDSRMTSLEIGQRQIVEKVDAVWEQTAILTEFKVEVNQKLDILIEENRAIKEIIGVHEVDLRRIKKII